MSSAHAVVDQELRHCHRQGKSSGLAVFHSGWMYIVVFVFFIIGIIMHTVHVSYIHNYIYKYTYCLVWGFDKSQTKICDCI